MKQQIEQQVKAIYDQLPYPGIDSGNMIPTMSWSCVNVDWIGSLIPKALNGIPPFKRILVAGCGTGNEAFQMQNRFPDAEITAVDYSKESIRIAKKYQNGSPSHANVRFEVVDLTVEESKWVKADHYDFISCHGVVSYIPNTQRVFDLFAKCLSKDGILYLGVNGAAHFGINIRKSFEYYGQNPSKFKDTLETRRLIELFDRLLPEQSHVANGISTYLGSDILSPFSLDLTLSEWIEYAEKAELHFISSAKLIIGLSKTLAPTIFPLLIPKSRKELCELIDINNSAAFHRLIFSKSVSRPIPWYDLSELLDYEFQTTRLYSTQNPTSDIYGELLLNATIANGHEQSLRWPLNDLNMKLIQQEESRRIRDALGDSINAYENNPNELLVKLFMFHHLGIIKILPNSSQ